MIACLFFDKAAFPGLENVRLWLTSQAGERRKLMGELCERGKFAIANAHGRGWFVYRFADISTGKVPLVSNCKAGEPIEGGVIAYGYQG